MGPSMVHRHRDVQGGTARAAVFGVSDGLVSNVALILGIAGATSDPAVIRVAGVSGLLAGAVSMAAGEYISLKAQTELVERELQIERESIAENPEDETEELAAIYRERGLGAEEADQVAEVLMSDPDVASSALSTGRAATSNSAAVAAAKRSRFSGVGENTLTSLICGRTASTASIWARACLPDPRMPSVSESSRARYFAATPVVAPTLSGETA